MSYEMPEMSDESVGKGVSVHIGGVRERKNWRVVFCLFSVSTADRTCRCTCRGPAELPLGWGVGVQVEVRVRARVGVS